jgi:2-keto-4-pentenoate hydratase/2-oxohepta-3-ene-1,7-dioic acid hydratase in catechol pathway
VFVTPDELGEAWIDSKLHRPLVTHVNGQWFGAPEAGVDMQFNFAQLVAHAAKTRPLSAGTIVGSGTVANEDTRARRLLLRRAAHRRNPARRQAEHALHEVRRRGAHRDVRCGGSQHLRRHRTAHGAAGPLIRSQLLRYRP